MFCPFFSQIDFSKEVKGLDAKLCKMDAKLERERKQPKTEELMHKIKGQSEKKRDKVKRRCNPGCLVVVGDIRLIAVCEYGREGRRS